jgi:hypothetical protein
MLQQLYPKAQYSQGHPLLANGLANLGLLLWARGQGAAAERRLGQALAMYQGLARAFADTAAEAQALNFLACLPPARDAYLTLSAPLPPPPGAVTPCSGAARGR